MLQPSAGVRYPGVMLIREARATDAEVIARFNARMALETEHLQLDEARLLEGVKAVLADASKGFYRVAEIDGRVAGQAMITYEWSDWRNANFWWLQSVYVDGAYRGRGVFSAIYESVIVEARNAGACGMRLYVERENERAQRTYARLGMRSADYVMYEVDFVLTRV
jgi:ribosomal protein S18 acetylase RimI-like enzyme